MKRRTLGPLAIGAGLILIVFLVYRWLDMAVTVDHQQSQIRLLQHQQNESLEVMNRLLVGVSRSEIRRVSAESPGEDFIKEDGTSLVVGSLKYDFIDDRCVRISVE